MLPFSEEKVSICIQQIWISREKPEFLEMYWLRSFLLSISPEHFAHWSLTEKEYADIIRTLRVWLTTCVLLSAFGVSGIFCSFLPFVNFNFLLFHCTLGEGRQIWCYLLKIHICVPYSQINFSFVSAPVLLPRSASVCAFARARLIHNVFLQEPVHLCFIG